MANGKKSRVPVRNAVCLFAGGGGLSLGLEQAGFRVAMASDIEPSSRDTFSKNRPEVPFLLKDVRHLTREEVETPLAGSSVDLIAGGPPCQGFSTIGDQLVADPRNQLFEAFIRVIRWLNPACVLMENVSYLRSQYNGRYEQEIVSALESLGYTVSVTTLNAADYGVPQIRKRVFFVGSRSQAQFKWPDPTHAESVRDGRLPYLTVGEAIMDLADLDEQSGPANHIPLNHSQKVVSRYLLIPEGGRMPPPQDLPAEIRRRNFGNTYKRLVS